MADSKQEYFRNRYQERHEVEDEDASKAKELLIREENLEIVRMKKLKWVNIAMSRSVVMDAIGEAVRRSEVAHCGVLVQEMMGRAWLELETRRLVGEFMEADTEVQREVGRRIREAKLETARRKKEACIARNIIKCITLELMDKAVVLSEESHCSDMVWEMAWLIKKEESLFKMHPFVALFTINN